LVAKLGGTARNFRDPENPNLVGLIFEVPDVQALAIFMKSAEVAKAMAEDGVKPETLRMAVEFTPWTSAFGETIGKPILLRLPSVGPAYGVSAYADVFDEEPEKVATSPLYKARKPTDRAGATKGRS